MEGMGKKKKKAQLRKDIKEAKEAGYDVVIKYDPESGDYLPTFSYKQPTKTQAEKDAEVTEIFQGEAQQAYGGGFERTQGVLNQPVASRVDPRTGQQIPVMRRETGGPIGGPGHAGPMRAKEQQMQQFRAPFDRAGQTMRPGASGKFAPVKDPRAPGIGPGGPNQNQIMQLAEKLAQNAGDEVDAEGNFMADKRSLGERIKEKIAVAKTLYQATGGQLNPQTITGQKDSYGYSIGETMPDENDDMYVYIGNDKWELVEK